ncbi:hypothetical protein TWF788_010235 [Orbilia oligospora]|uniref:OTU domain-containing protein n=1 Tax=Orbilia oligospora TaxID=2813651 RepID=A0A7C8KBC9_ORBOL|nr:hypothetical protein TWF788_010235 [Orbilia oligospora]
MEDLLTLHRKQLRDLQSVITQKKKFATKKTRRGVNDDCERLERELKEKQASEIVALETELNPNAAADDDDDGNKGSSEPVVGDNPEPEADKEEQDISSKLQETTLEDPTTTTTPTNHERIEPPSSSSSSSKKPNRAKARLARRAAQIEEITAQAQQEAATQPNPRAIEAERMKQLFAENGLTEIQIAPDGHCLYSAFATGLEGAGIPLSDESASDGTKQRGYTFTRKAAGRYIESHPDDFTPFLEEGETLDGHVRKVTSTAEWGGQMELLALAKEYGVTVKVVQAQGVGVTAMNEEEGEKADVWLAYHRKGYGLGEHYNALRKK